MSGAIVPKCRSFAAPYPCYLCEHRHRSSHLMQVVGSSLALIFRRGKIRF